MVQTASSVPDLFAATSGQRDPNRNTADHRFAGNGAGQRNNARHHSIVHQIAERSVVLRRRSARRRLARIDPESVERRAWRIIGGGANSPTHP